MIALRSSILLLAVLALGACDDDDDPVQPRTLVCGAVLEDADGAGTEIETDATGDALFAIVGTEMEWEVNSTGIDDFSAAHIHRENGSILVPGVGSFTLDETGSGSGTMTVTEDQVDIIEAGGTFFNVHTDTYTGGEISGDLVCE